MSDWEFYGKDKIIIGTTIFTLEELQNAVENKFERDKSKIEDLNKLNEFIGKELETYKKIAEKLAISMIEIDTDEKELYEIVCENRTCKEKGNCTKCIIDWARNEVEKDGNYSSSSDKN